MNEPLVSIIVPVYNVEELISRCIESLAKQSYSNIEILLIDDGSTMDNSPAICDDYAGRDKRIKFVHKENGGVSSARNTGLDIANGEFVCFCDSDDYVSKDYISNFIEGLTPDTDLVFQGIIDVYKDQETEKLPENKLYRQEYLLDGIADIDRLGTFGFVCNKLYRKSIIDTHSLRFDTSISISEDRIFALQYMCFIRGMRTVAKGAYYYEIRNAGLTMKKRSDEEIKIAAERNLEESEHLLTLYKSENFRLNMKHFHIMSSVHCLSILFDQNYPLDYCKKEIFLFMQKYGKWLPLYKARNKKQWVLMFVIGHLPAAVSVPVLYSIWKIKYHS